MPDIAKHGILTKPLSAKKARVNFFFSASDTRQLIWPFAI